jgi:phage-related minor tail protein
MRGGVGLMGEAGPEAIMPLARGADGRLGIRGGGGGGAVSVTMNITSPDAEGFRRSQSQVAAEMSRAIQRGRRNL